MLRRMNLRAVSRCSGLTFDDACEGRRVAGGVAFRPRHRSTALFLPGAAFAHV